MSSHDGRREREGHMDEEIPPTRMRKGEYFVYATMVWPGGGEDGAYTMMWQLSDLMGDKNRRQRLTEEEEEDGQTFATVDEIVKAMRDQLENAQQMGQMDDEGMTLKILIGKQPIPDEMK